MLTRPIERTYWSTWIPRYIEICRLESPQMKEAVRAAAFFAMRNWKVKCDRREFFKLGEIQQLPKGARILPKIKDKDRQEFRDAYGNLWKRVGSARGDMRLMIEKAERQDADSSCQREGVEDREHSGLLTNSGSSSQATPSDQSEASVSEEI